MTSWDELRAKYYAGVSDDTLRDLLPPRFEGQFVVANSTLTEDSLWIECAYGVPGDRLWVRETFQYEAKTDAFEWDVRNCIIRYRATEPGAGPWLTAEDDISDAWRPSIHMPRWASRLTLEVTGVRVERVQDISEEDAKAEGSTVPWMYKATQEPVATHRAAFARLWDSINAKRAPWSSNPWVWVVAFKPIAAASTEERRP
ncbi:MAG: hypothetical protein H3C62_02410 [Gemmatimonadaceae bacterium]|nr:hypothetical protein [Gemmatimonadaceae bacterium]